MLLSADTEAVLIHSADYNDRYMSWLSGARYRLHREIPSLQVLAKGLDEAVALSSTNASDGLPGFSFGCLFVHNPLRHFFSQLDFVFFISIIGSLMAFVFTYDAVSGERRRGTLRLVMIQPISRPSVLLSKFVGSYMSFLISIVPALVGVVWRMSSRKSREAQTGFPTMVRFTMRSGEMCGMFHQVVGHGQTVMHAIQYVYRGRRLA